MKKITFLVVALCATMFVSAATKTSTFTDKNWTAGTDEPAWISSGAAANSFDSSNGRGVQITLKSINESGLTLTCSSVAETITGVSLVMSSNKDAAKGTATVAVQVGTTDFLSNSYVLDSIEKANNQVYDFVGSATGNVVVSFTSDTVKSSVYVKSITITYVSTGVEDPEFSLAEGIYTSAQNVELSCATEGAKIYYTLDGSEPTSASSEYSAAIVLSETTTIKAIAIKDANESAVKSKTYTIVELEGEGTEENPYTCADVVKLNNSLGKTNQYWVVGYIIGGVKSQDNNLVIDTANAAAIGLADARGEIIEVPVALDASSNARTNLNCKDNPNMVGAKVKVYGTLEVYFSHAGVKGVGAESDYVILEQPVTAIESIEVSNIYGANGTIYGAEGARIYTITGMDVTEQNGSLNGAYIVRMGEKAVKVIVK